MSALHQDCIGEEKQLKRASRRRRARAIPDQVIRQVLEQPVSRVFLVSGRDLWSGTRGQPQAAFARQVAMYLAHVACGLTLTEVGHVFVRDRTTVAHACELIEEEREDPMFDRALELLEGATRTLLPAEDLPARN